MRLQPGVVGVGGAVPFGGKLARTLAEFQAHVLALSGSRNAFWDDVNYSWGNGNYFRTQAFNANSGQLLGSPFNQFQGSEGYMVNFALTRLWVRHCISTEAQYLAQVANNGLLLCRYSNSFLVTQDGVIAAGRTRNGLTSEGVSIVPFQDQITLFDRCIWWDYSQGKAVYTDPQNGIGPLDYTWV